MSGTILLTVLITIFFIASASGTVVVLCRCRRLAIVEVEKLIRPADVNDFRNLLLAGVLGDPIFRANFSRQEYKESVRDRLYKAQEYMRRMSHNSLIMAILSRTTIWRERKYKPGMEGAEEFIRLGRELLLAAITFRVYTFLTLVRIKWWMVFRIHGWFPLPMPNIGDLQQIWGLKFMPCYSQFKEAAGALCLAHGHEFYDDIATRF